MLISSLFSLSRFLGGWLLSSCLPSGCLSLGGWLSLGRRLASSLSLGRRPSFGRGLACSLPLGRRLSFRRGLSLGWLSLCSRLSLSGRLSGRGLAPRGLSGGRLSSRGFPTSRLSLGCLSCGSSLHCHLSSTSEKLFLCTSFRKIRDVVSMQKALSLRDFQAM